MNYLAHSFLAFTDAQIVGQFLEDYIRNSERFSFPEIIQKGITMHREVDTFTDSHPAIHEAKKVFSPLVRLYSGAFVDVAMDYFLANDSTIFSETTLKHHSKKVYRVLNENYKLLPEKLKMVVARMEKDDWLYHYKNDNGIKFSMQNVLNKANYLEKDIPIFEAFLENKGELKRCYDLFFPELMEHCKMINAEF